MKLRVNDSSVLETVGRRGALSYEFERAGQRTILTGSSCSSPWHHFPPVYLDDSGCAYTWLVNPSGGLVGGDHVSIEARLHAGSHVLMTSPSANRVYRTLSAPAVQEVRLSLGPGARLEWVPDLTIPFAGSRFRQMIHVDLAPGATVMLWDALAAGRIAMQERWAFAGVDNEICVRTANGASIVERFQLTPDCIGTIAAEWNYAGSLFVIGEGYTREQLTGLESSLAALCEEPTGELLGGVSEPAAPGLVVKLMARSAPALTRFLEAACKEVRASLWNISAAVLRKY